MTQSTIYTTKIDAGTQYLQTEDDRRNCTQQSAEITFVWESYTEKENMCCVRFKTNYNIQKKLVLLIQP